MKSRGAASCARLAVWVLAVIVASSASPASRKKLAKATPTPSPSPIPQPIETTGSILGVTLFSSLEEAREKMERFKLEKAPGADNSEKEREGGERMIWRLVETEYLWIVAWANKEGKVIKISASVRPEKQKPFREIGDLSRAKAHNESMAMWIAQHSDGTYYRVVAKGPAEKASSIYLYSLKTGQYD